MGLRKLRKRVRRFIVDLTITYWMVLLAVWVLRVLPERVALWIGRLGGTVFYCLDFRHRPICMSNLEIAFPDKPIEERRRISRACYRHLGQSVAEFSRFPKINAGNIHDYMAVENFGMVRKLLDEGRGVIGVTGHVGLWEFAGHAAACMGFPLDSIARPLDSTKINRLVESLRSKQGQRIVNKEGALRQIVKSLREGRLFGLVMDQHAGSDGLWVPFFGRPASTIDTAARLHLKLGLPIVVVTSYRIGSGFRHSFRARGPLKFDLTGNQEEDIRIITAACNAALEEAIREHPEQWLWQHRRWKEKRRKESRHSELPAGAPGAEASKSIG